MLSRASQSRRFSPADFGGRLALWLEADKSNTLFTTVAGSTQPAHGGTVGRWEDRSMYGFHLTAAADDTTRPTFNASGGLCWVEGDGTNDALSRAASLGMYAAGACSVFVAVRGNNVANRSLIAERRTSNSAPAYIPLYANNTTASTLAAFIRNDASATQVATSSSLQTNVFDGTDVVVGVVDDGSSLTAYEDGVAGTPLAYTRSGVLTLDLCTMFATVAHSATYFAARIYALVVVYGVLRSQEIADLTAYLGAKQGRPL